jgi:hypothetical protein
LRVVAEEGLDVGVNLLLQRRNVSLRVSELSKVLDVEHLNESNIEQLCLNASRGTAGF